MCSPEPFDIDAFHDILPVYRQGLLASERKRARSFDNIVRIDEIIEPIVQMKNEVSVMLACQIPEDLIDRGGYHIPQAEDGDFEQVKRRFETQSRIEIMQPACLQHKLGGPSLHRIVCS